MAQITSSDAKKVEENHETPPQGEAIERSADPNRWKIGCYDLFDKNHYPGKFIIFNHSEFALHLALNKRTGTDKDAERIERTFKNLGFQEAMQRQDNLEFDEIIPILKKVLRQDFTYYGSIVVVILTHGTRRNLYAYDQLYEMDKIKNLFVEKEVATKLAKKPKIFLIQACQGGQADDGVVASSESDSDSDDDKVGSGDESYTKKTRVITIPIMADFLLAFSSAAGYVSFRGDKGSWFIQALCDAIEEFCETTDFENILTLVKYDIAYNKSVSNPDDRKLYKKKQIPEVTSTFTKKLYLTQVTAAISDQAVNSPSQTTQHPNPCFGENFKDLMLWILICIIVTFIGTWYMFTEIQPEYHFHCYSAHENSTEAHSR